MCVCSKIYSIEIGLLKGKSRKLNINIHTHTYLHSDNCGFSSGIGQIRKKKKNIKRKLVKISKREGTCGSKHKSIKYTYLYRLPP